MTTATARGIQDFLQTATRRLTDTGIPDGRREAETLIAFILNCARLDLYRAVRLTLDPDQQETFERLIRRRARREPLQYILGTQEFWGLEFRVTTDTLIPRPETELLIEAVLERIPEFLPPKTVVDLGTGSGCLAVVIARRYPDARIRATDRSPAALTVARLNAARHGAAGRIEFLEGDLFEPLTALGLTGTIDLLLSNPPYIPTDEIPKLQPEVRLHEPRRALDGGPDGLDFYRRILPSAFDLLRPGGLLGLELGIRQAVPVCAIARRIGWRRVALKKDLGGVDRVVIFTKP